MDALLFLSAKRDHGTRSSLSLWKLWRGVIFPPNSYAGVYTLKCRYVISVLFTLLFLKEITNFLGFLSVVNVKHSGSNLWYFDDISKCGIVLMYILLSNYALRLLYRLQHVCGWAARAMPLEKTVLWCNTPKVLGDSRTSWINYRQSRKRMLSQSEFDLIVK